MGFDRWPRLQDLRPSRRKRVQTLIYQGHYRRCLQFKLLGAGAGEEEAELMRRQDE
jgi:hypothetical protein